MMSLASQMLQKKYLCSVMNETGHNVKNMVKGYRDFSWTHLAAFL